MDEILASVDSAGERVPRYEEDRGSEEDRGREEAGEGETGREEEEGTRENSRGKSFIAFQGCRKSVSRKSVWGAAKFERGLQNLTF